MQLADTGGVAYLVLVSRVRAEDLTEVAFRRHYAEIFQFLRRRTASATDAEELAQAVFADAAAAFPRGHVRAPSVRAWVYRVARRRLVDRRRDQHRQDRIRESAPFRYEPVATNDLARELQEAIRTLPQGQRDVTVMKLLRGCSFAEIASQLELTEAACKMRFVRALQTIREHLVQAGIGP